jgi:hypothetical protein
MKGLRRLRGGLWRVVARPGMLAGVLVAGTESNLTATTNVRDKLRGSRNGGYLLLN